MAFPIDLPHSVNVEYDAGTAGGHGGNRRNWQPLASGVACLITQGSGTRPMRFAQQGGHSPYTVSGTDPSLGRDDVRLTVVVGPRAGKVLRVTGVSQHGPVAGTLDTPFYRAMCEEDLT